MYLVFDTETTGLPQNYNAPLTDFENWPRLVQLAWQVHDKSGNLTEVQNIIVRPDGFEIPFNSEQVHGISTERALKEGIPVGEALEIFQKSLDTCEFAVGHNVEFDLNIVGCEYLRLHQPNPFESKKSLCTKEESTDFCAIPGGRGGKFKWPNLAELHDKLFSESFDEAHNASADVVATARCFLELLRLGVITRNKAGLNDDEFQSFKEVNPNTIKPVEIEIISNFNEPKTSVEVSESDQELIPSQVTFQSEGTTKDTAPFIHLNVHTQYSILDGAAEIKKLVKKAKDDGMPGLAITDHGNLFGVKEFFNVCTKEGLKPIIGCEFYLAKRGMYEKSEKIDGGGDHLILLALNQNGYQNLLKLVSYSYTEGFYYKPRIDKALLKKHHEDLIALSSGIFGEISKNILDLGVEAAKKSLEEYKSIFGDRLYLELHRHPTGDPNQDKKIYDRQVYANKELRKLAEEFEVPLVVTNNVHFINEEDSEAHDRLVCLNTGRELTDPDRFRYTGQEWFKTQQEMRELFKDAPTALENTYKVYDRIEAFDLNSDPILPAFPLPDEFENEDNYLKHLTFEGAKKRWGEVNEAQTERLEFELETIKKMGFPGYFLIVQDFIQAARDMGVSVGPGRGSAAGSAVAYCLKITDIDPIAYDLLFERFLNPDRISMPDIDIDFDEDGREKVLRWVVDKYGEKRVAHIITFGTMAAKMAIRDVARIEQLPLSDADRLAKLVPERPGTTLEQAFKEAPELNEEKLNGNELTRKVLSFAETLEGSVRHTGLHACGIIIGKNDLEEHIPLCISKDSDLYVSQYDGKHIEDVGMLKMDFLGLKTLSIIMDAVDNVKESVGDEIDIDSIGLEDEATYALYARGETTGLFQFESPGMKKHLKDLKPNRFGDLIAMNALYRPGPMEYIPSFIRRKHGTEKIEYDLPELEEYLEETYGITVYQEQVMLLSRKLANFTRGQADSLRKAMGKKNIELMNKLKVEFDKGCQTNGHDKKITDKIWNDWKAFAQYAFNKSHSTCYAYVSYQTAYLKAHYPGQFMAAVLSRNINDLKKITIFMDECKRMGMSVLSPDVNESGVKFNVNKAGNIRFALTAIKGVGEAAVLNILQERQENGPFKDVYDFVERVNLQSVNKKNIEALVCAGAFDEISDFKRGQYFLEDAQGGTFIEQLVRYGNQIQNESKSAQQSLFGGDTNITVIQKPSVEQDTDWSTLERLNKEKELIGIYLSAHPLDTYKLEIATFCRNTIADIEEYSQNKGKEFSLAGIVTNVRHGFTKSNKPFGSMTIEDYTDSHSIMLFGKDYMNFKSYMTTGYCLMVKGSMQPRFYNSEELEFKVSHMNLLSSTKDEMIRKISLTVSSKSITEDFIETIKNFTDSEEGKVQLNFKIVDAEEKIAIEMFSRSKKVNLTQEFVEFLDNYDEIHYKVSS